MKYLPDIMTVAIVLLFLGILILMSLTGCSTTYIPKETPSPTEAILSNTVVTTTSTSTTGT